MTTTKRTALALVALLATAATTPALAQVQITEWMYVGNGTRPEFIEFTNLGSAAVDFTGWVYDDDSRFSTVAAGGFSLSGFGVVGVGESVVLSEDTAANFRTDWGLGAQVKVIGGYTNNLGRNDEINLFDNNGVLVDRLTYGDQTYLGTIRTQTASGAPTSLAALAPFTVTSANWVLSATSDSFGSHLATSGNVGSPGTFALAPTSAVPEPETYALLLAGLAVVGGMARRRQARG